MRYLLRYGLLICATLCQLSCSKTYVDTASSSGNLPKSIASIPDTVCRLSAISQIDGSAVYNQWLYTRDAAQLLKQIQFKDNINQTTPISLSLQYKGDTVLLDSVSWMIRAPQTGYVTQFFTRIKKSSILSDNVLYNYIYDTNGRLKQKSAYYNQASLPDFITHYYYNNNNLINCQLFTGDEKKRLLQSKISYDVTREIKPWIYLFTDSFDEYPYLPIFHFGIYPQNPVTQVQTIIYDVTNDTVKDQWTTQFNGYLFSADNYVVQVTTAGAPQQGLGFLLGTQRFDYKCWH